ncbi:DUF2255 family protein [Streptomyces sp. NPDC007901]|uniref:DUF2255 family protein n=1 Tax=Streptomyces sp. NPDC007901 TaxID=3364785 RepID=UPI0036ED2153
MTHWNDADLAKVGAAEEPDLESERADGTDGTLRAPVTMWVVRSGDHLYVRSVKGTAGPWYRGIRSRDQGRVTAGGVCQDVTFHPADPDEYAAVDAASNPADSPCPAAAGSAQAPDHVSDRSHRTRGRRPLGTMPAGTPEGRVGGVCVSRVPLPCRCLE